MNDLSLAKAESDRKLYKKEIQRQIDSWQRQIIQKQWEDYKRQERMLRKEKKK